MSLLSDLEFLRNLKALLRQQGHSDWPVCQVSLKGSRVVAVPTGVVLENRPLVAPAGTTTRWAAVSESCCRGRRYSGGGSGGRCGRLG
jgi:hypothetical protein